MTSRSGRLLRRGRYAVPCYVSQASKCLTERPGTREWLLAEKTRGSSQRKLLMSGQGRSREALRMSLLSCWAHELLLLSCGAAEQPSGGP